MHKLVRLVVMFGLIGAAGLTAAATPEEFYSGLLQRGISDYEAGRFEEAAHRLRIAAFGLIDASEQYQIANIYLAVAADRANDPANARHGAQRVVLAERRSARFAALTLPAGVRAAFDAVARKVLTAAEVAALAVDRTNRTDRTDTKPKVNPPVPVQKAPETVQKAPETVQPAPAPVQKAPAPAQTVPAPAQKVPAPVQKNPEPVQTVPATVQKPPATVQTAPAPVQTAPAPVQKNPAPVQTAPAPKTIDIPASFAAAERALNEANLVEARRIYRQVLAISLNHEQALRVAEGLYRARDFQGALDAFAKAGTLARGEEPYRYYLAVAYYETGQYERAKRELKAVLPFIEVTPDVARYRTKIEGAID